MANKWLPVLMAGCVASPASAETQLVIDAALRDAKGMVRICLTRNPAGFPGSCETDPHAIRRSVPAAAKVEIVIDDLPAGDYAIALIHDSNSNGRLDMIGPLPIEGFGFSGNPALSFGAPSFRRARFTIGPGVSRQVIRVRYLL